MLVLTRHGNQSIMIGDDVVVTVLEVRGDHVRLGITAPRSIEVHREEVFVALRRTKPGS
jgi:carbon storage regulator